VLSDWLLNFFFYGLINEAAWMTGKSYLHLKEPGTFIFHQQARRPLAARSCLHLQPSAPATGFSIVHYADRTVQS
jgi:hypothetical protein